jgi:hypothetical protein
MNIAIKAIANHIAISAIVRLLIIGFFIRISKVAMIPNEIPNAKLEMRTVAL